MKHLIVKRTDAHGERGQRSSRSSQRWARRVFGGTGTGTGSVPVPVPVPELLFHCPLLPFQDPFFVRSSFRSRHLFFFFGTGLELTRSSYCYYRSSCRSRPFQIPFLISSRFLFLTHFDLLEWVVPVIAITIPNTIPSLFLSLFWISSNFCSIVWYVSTKVLP